MKKLYRHSAQRQRSLFGKLDENADKTEKREQYRWKWYKIIQIKVNNMSCIRSCMDDHHRRINHD
jgi:hypothetical protein